jgi:hypothetical protein
MPPLFARPTPVAKEPSNPLDGRDLLSGIGGGDDRFCAKHDEQSAE